MSLLTVCPNKHSNLRREGNMQYSSLHQTLLKLVNGEISSVQFLNLCHANIVSHIGLKPLMLIRQLFYRKIQPKRKSIFENPRWCHCLNFFSLTYNFATVCRERMMPDTNWLQTFIYSGRNWISKPAKFLGGCKIWSF